MLNKQPNTQTTNMYLAIKHFRALVNIVWKSLGTDILPMSLEVFTPSRSELDIWRRNCEKIYESCNFINDYIKKLIIAYNISIVLVRRHEGEVHTLFEDIINNSMIDIRAYYNEQQEK